MKSLLILVRALIWFAGLFLVGVIGTIWVSGMIYGADAISGAGQSFAILVLGEFIGFMLAVIGTPVIYHFVSRRKPEVEEPSN
jgi:hypothetical protein